MVNATRVAAVDGDAYMYQDFTGYSLEARDYDLTVSLDRLAHFTPGNPVKTLSFSWLAQGGGNAQWTGLTLEARCYSAGRPPPAFESVVPVLPAGLVTF